MAAPDSEDEALKAAIAMSLADQQTNQNNDHTSSDMREETHAASANSVAPSSVDLSAMSLAGLDRKAMEEARLARLARKRERSISPPPLGSRKAPKLEAKTVSLPSGAMLRSFTSTVNQDQRGRKSENANAANQHVKLPRDSDAQHPTNAIKSEVQPSVKSDGLLYPNGVVKKTWSFGFERTGSDAKMEEVLEASTLRTALLSAFQWDVDWVMSKLKTPGNGGTTKCIFVMEAKTDELRQQMLQETEHMRSHLRLCFPPMYTPINCMHSKLMLLFHEKKLRIAVPTANLLSFDWGENATMENRLVDAPPNRITHDVQQKL